MSAKTTAGSKTSRALGTRDQEVLRDIIHTYIVSGRPVSSRSVSRQVEPSLSAATIRNVMVDLEEAGLLYQPHTSAGRVPTQAAYRLYVESLMLEERLSKRERRYIEENLRDARGDSEGLIDAATQLLSELSHKVGVGLKPTVGDTVLKAIDFVSLDERRVLCVVVSASGFIDNFVIDLEESLSREELVRISNYVNENFAGMTLRTIRDRLLAQMSEERALVDHHLSFTIEIARRALDRSQAPGVLVRGTNVLLDQPELADVDRIRRVLDTFSDKARMVSLLNKCLSGEGVRVVIGEESELTSELDFSLVATGYGIGHQQLGSLGILGPSRMEYARVISLVHFLGQTLSATLAASAID